MTATTFHVHPTPLGDVLALTSDAGLVGLEILEAPAGARLLAWTGMLGREPRPAETEAAILRQLDEYFAGERTAFDVEIDWSLVSGFVRDALQAVCTIPYGETASYGEVAAMAGRLRAHRAVGTACARTPISIVVPAHRVVRADGSIGEYGGHPEHKRMLLDLETAHRPAGV